jgi:dihydropteroate synthase
MTGQHIHFVTGRLAEHALRGVVEDLALRLGFRYTIDVLPITVAALMTPAWIARHIQVAEGATGVLLPGYCDGDLRVVEAAAGVAVQRGPRDLLQLVEFFGQTDERQRDYGAYDIEIVAEINHAPRLTRDEILLQATRLANDGADVIDVGCDPGETWRGVADCIRALRDAGHRVSIDSFNSAEVELAIGAGAELVLSVNSSNCDAAKDWGCQVVVIPDDLATLGGLDETIEALTSAGVRLRIDPVLEPIGLGLAASLGRYLEVRRRYGDAEMMMGVGNLTELTDADSAGINVLLLGICQELGIRSVLTTQVINWARSSVKECDLARRLVYFAARHQVPPKHIEPKLVMLRDPKLYETGADQLQQLAEQIKDNNYRIFAQREQLHLVSAQLHLRAADPFLLFDRLMATQPKNIDPSHAFYLGYELAKAATALALGKQYRQDESLDWGFLTVLEASHRLKRSAYRRQLPGDSDGNLDAEQDTPRPEISG